MEYLPIEKRHSANAESSVKIGCKMTENPIFTINMETLYETTVIHNRVTIPLSGFGIRICNKSMISCTQLKVHKTTIFRIHVSDHK
jgi:hypothetical protein